MKTVSVFAATVALVLGSITGATADSSSSSAGSDSEMVFGDDWVVSTTPYFWITNYEGDMTINGQTVDMSGTNVFDLLDAGDLRFVPLVNYFEARKGRWGGYLDTTLLGLEFGSIIFHKSLWFSLAEVPIPIPQWLIDCMNVPKLSSMIFT